MTAPAMQYQYVPQGKRNRGAKELERTSAADANFYGGQSRRAMQMYNSALGDPTGTADMFGGYFQQAAEGLTRPALADFSRTISGVQANAASRFGGNVSGEEFRLTQRAGDDFSRNLTDALARLAPQQVAAGQQYTAQLGQGFDRSAGQYNRSRADLQDAVGQLPQGGGFFGGLLGTALGIGSLAIPGGGTIGGAVLGKLGLGGMGGGK